jgi:hypothetical protein
MDERDIPGTMEFVERLLPKMTNGEVCDLLNLLSKVEDRILLQRKDGDT